jgi:DNA repair exonuclease SbcCD ATPase subunit
MSKYNFPKIENIIIRNFSLFSKNGNVYEVNEKIDEGVYCLAGANGLGKTTFLNALNYGLTGIVLAPDKQVLSPEEIVKENQRFTSRYFNGRIVEKDKENAEIEISLKINNKYYKFIRGFFEIDSLRYLEIFKMDNKKKISLISTENHTPKELKRKYETEIAKDIGINNFEYFMFLQLYVLTFDENRRMIFWDKRASSHTLSIAFNTSIKDTEKLIGIKRKMEKLESDGRNSRWQATQILNKIENLIETQEGDTNQEEEDIGMDYDELLKKHADIKNEFNNVKFEYDTLLKRQSFLNSEIMHLRLKHTKLFSIYSEPRSKLLNNAYVKMSISKNECMICGAKSEQVIESIKNSLYKENCPLCNTKISDNKEQEQSELLLQIENNDEKISKSKRELENITLESSGKKLELEKVEYEFIEIDKEKTLFEESNPSTLLKSTKTGSIDFIIKQYKEQFYEFDRIAKEKYKARDKLRPEHESLQAKTENVYKEAEVDFVPIFQKLANSFIGLDLNIRILNEKRNLKLVLDLKNSARTESFHLSESQRFFLDIALRMSLAIYLSKQSNETTMLIDTPEGSLDIAYESRVGEMFANFVKDYNQNILMTANINASQLLISLAKKCGVEKMLFKRMLDWTDLSIIQQEGENLFEQVYNNIEIALNEGKNG